MNTQPPPSPSGASAHAVTIARAAHDEWHAVEDDLVVGRGYASARPDGRLFVGIDAWHDAVFDRLAAALLADLPRPLHAVVDESEPDASAGWARAGFAPHRREWHYRVTPGPADAPSDAPTASQSASSAPAGVTIVPAGDVREQPLRALDEVIRAEIAEGLGWPAMPVEIFRRPAGGRVADPSKYTVAARGDRYVALLRVVARKQHARIGLLAVRADEQRKGIGRALLTGVLDTLYHAGCTTASAEIDASNAAAIALFEGAGAERTGSNLELLRR